MFVLFQVFKVLPGNRCLPLLVLLPPAWKSMASICRPRPNGPVNVMHAQMQPARLPRTGESDSLERREGVVRDPGLISRYRARFKKHWMSLKLTKRPSSSTILPLAIAASAFAMFTRFNCPLPLNSTTTTKEETWALSGGYGKLRMSQQTHVKMPA